MGDRNQTLLGVQWKIVFVTQDGNLKRVGLQRADSRPFMAEGSLRFLSAHEGGALTKDLTMDKASVRVIWQSLSLSKKRHSFDDGNNARVEVHIAKLVE